MSESSISIAGHSIGPAHPPYVIAELSANHNGDIGRAFAVMEAASSESPPDRVVSRLPLKEPRAHAPPGLLSSPSRAPPA